MADRVTAHEIFHNARRAAQDELNRSSSGLAFSGFSAGLNISFSFVAAVLLADAATDPESAHLWSAVGYPLGFILIVLARAQLFTENTLTPVLLVLDHPSRRNILNTLRLWTVVLVANLAGAFVFSLAMSTLDISPGMNPETITRTAMEAYQGTWANLWIRGIFGGWLIALMTWVLHTGGGMIGQIVLVWLIAFIIQAAGFSHSVAGATEILYLAHVGEISYLDWLWHFQVPVTLGNAFGGIFFVALVNYAQVVGSGGDLERADRVKRIREQKESVDREEEQ